jgi:predicted LPLAT superfamily acyltransferase
MGPEDIVAAFDARPIRRALLQNRPVLLAGDGRRASRFLEMPILGRPYPLATGFAEMAFWVGCPVLPVFAVEGEQRHTVRVEVGSALPLDPAAALEENLAVYARVLDAQLRRAPHLWSLWSTPDLFEGTRVWSGSNLADRYSRDWRRSD